MFKYSPSTKGFYDEGFPVDKIPDDAIEISDELHNQLLLQEISGKVIQFDETENKPISSDPIPLSESEQAKNSIAALEFTITPRRIREAILGTDKGWLANVDAQIAALRKKL